MPPWPEILSKYNLLISQTTNLQVGLSQLDGGGGRLLERIALHPSSGMTDLELDTQIIPLLRTQQTNDVLADENATVRRLAERLRVGEGALGEEVISECDEIKRGHDSRVERAFRAVNMLRDKYQWKNWKAEVQEEEPEELRWQANANGEEDEDMDDEYDDDDDEEEEEVQGELNAMGGGDSEMLDVHVA